MSLDLCVVTGTVYKPDSTSESLVPASGARLYVKVVKTALIVGTGEMRVPADTNGQISFTVPQNSQILVQGDATIGSGADLTKGKSFQVPDAESTTLESLAAVSTIPLSGLTVTGLAHKIGTLTFDSTDFTLTESPTGVAGIALSLERIQDIVGALLRGVDGINVDYDDPGNSLTIRPEAALDFSEDGNGLIALF